MLYRHPNISVLGLRGLGLTQLPEAIIHWPGLYSIQFSFNLITAFPLLPAGDYYDIKAVPNPIIRVPSGYLSRVQPILDSLWDDSSIPTRCRFNGQTLSWRCVCGAGTSHPPGQLDACDWECPVLSVNGQLVSGPIGVQVQINCSASLAVTIQCALGSASDDYAVWQVASQQSAGVDCDILSGVCLCPGNNGSLFNVPSRDTQPVPRALALPPTVQSIRLQQLDRLALDSVASWIKSSSPNLQSLQLHNCSLTTADLQMLLAVELPSLRHFDLSFNRLDALPSTTMRRLGSTTLEHLNVSQNRITTLKGSLSHFGFRNETAAAWSLSELDVSFNQLTALSREDSPAVGKLHVWDLRHNQIQTIDNNAISPVVELLDISSATVRRRRLQMDGNPSSCSLVSIPTKHGWEYQTIRCNCSSNLTNVPFCPRDRTVACDTSVNAQRVPIQSVCDGVKDCDNGADEASCSADLTLVSESSDCQAAKDPCDQPCIGDGAIVIEGGIATMQRARDCALPHPCQPLLMLTVALDRVIGLQALNPCMMHRQDTRGRFLHHAAPA